jgi:glycine cleavage system H lipoate-binding protein
MEAGVTEYKICDQDYNCDSCTYHLRLTGCKQLDHDSSESDFSPTVDISILAPNPDFFHPGIQYYENHCWIKHTSKSTILIGLDEFFMNLWCNVNSILLPQPGSKLDQNSTFCWILVPCGLACLKIPFASQVVSINADVQNLNFEDFRKLDWENKWLLKLNTNGQELDREKWLTKHQYLDLLNADSIAIKSFIKDYYTLESFGSISSGGEIMTSGPNIYSIPKHVFRNIVKQVFNNNHIFI